MSRLDFKPQTLARLDELLERWDDARERGEELSVAELCRDDPGLASEVERRIQVLRAWEGLADTSRAIDADTPTGPRPRPRTPNSAVITLNLTELQFHAQGGLGAIFKARDPRLGRDLAVKFPGDSSATFAEREIEKRFLREVRVTAALEHPGIVPVYGLGHDGEGRICYAMRFITAQTLKHAISEYHDSQGDISRKRSEPLRRDVAFRSLLQRFKSACVTVAYAHSRGYLHRDLKPEHILLGDFDVTLVVDWGLTKRWSDSEATPRPAGLEARQDPDSELRTETGIGTLGYASPEQQAGEWVLVGPTSDVFSLGATLYVLLTGQQPFPGSSNAEVLARVKRGELIPPRKKNPRVPRSLEAICLRAMALRPDDRYPTVSALVDDLSRWQADSPVKAHRENWTVRIRRTLDHHRIMLFMCLAAAVGGIGVATRGWLRERLHAAEVRSLAYVSAEKTAREQVLTRLPGWANEGLRQVATASQIATPLRSSATLRSLAAACLGGLDLAHSENLTDLPTGCLAFSPEGRRLAVGELFGDPGYRIQIIDLQLRRVIREHTFSCRGDAPRRSGVSSVRFSPDGHWLAVGLRNGNVLIWDATDDESEPRTVGNHRARILGLGFTADGSTLVSGSVDGDLGLIDRIEGRGWLQVRSIAVASDLSDLTISRNGPGVLVAGQFGFRELPIASIRSGELPRVTPRESSIPVDKLAIAPDGRTIALPSNTSRTIAIGAEPPREGLVDPELGVAHQEETSAVEFSPDGSLLVSGSADNTVKIWDLAARRMLLRLPVFSESVVIPSFHPTGETMAIGTSEGVSLYDLVGLDVCTTRALATGVVADFAFKPSDRSIDPPALVSIRAEIGSDRQSSRTVELWAGAGLRPVRSFFPPYTSVRWAEPMELHGPPRRAASLPSKLARYGLAGPGPAPESRDRQKARQRPLGAPRRRRFAGLGRDR